MSKRFIPLEQIEEMTPEERSFLSEKCCIKLGYYDPVEGVFVVMKAGEG